jgi:hypothetical protein
LRKEIAYVKDVSYVATDWVFWNPAMNPRKSVRILAVMVGLLSLPGVILFAVESIHSGDVITQQPERVIKRIVGIVGFLILAHGLWTFQRFSRIVVLLGSVVTLILLPLLFVALLKSPEQRYLGSAAIAYMMTVSLLNLCVLTRSQVRVLFAQSDAKNRPLVFHPPESK